MKKVLIGIVVIIVLGVLYYGLSPLLNVQEVDDALPEEVMVTDEHLSTEEQEEMMELIEEANTEAPKVMKEEMPVVEEVVEEEEMVMKTFPIMDTLGHPASGSVRIVETAEGTILRFEDFETINGPRLSLYLAKDLKATEFIDLGPIKGTKGNINYAVPEGVDLSEYQYVMHWCVPFRVLFNYADLSS